MTLTTLLLLFLMLPVQDPVIEKPQDPKRPAPKVERDWPPLKSVRKSIARDQLPRLISKDERKAQKARDLLLSYGAGVCPVLLDALGPTQKPELADEVEKMLDRLFAPEHAFALAEAYSGRNPPRDLYVVTRLAKLHERELLAFFQTAAKDDTAEVAEHAQFALAGLGEVSALPFLMRLAADSWDEKNYPIREALPALKGKPATDWLMEKLATGDTATKVAALRLLAGAGTKDAVRAVASNLDSREHQVRAGAVNALRGIVDKDPPFRHLSVFQAIEEVNKWKRRVGR